MWRSRPRQRWPPSFLPLMDRIQPPTHHHHRPHTLPSMFVRQCAAWVCAKRGMQKTRISLCILHTAYLARNSYQQLGAWSWESRSPYWMPWMDWICFVRNICYGLNGKEAMLAHCRGKQALKQEVAGGSTTPTWCRFSPNKYVAIYLLLDLLAVRGSFPV